MLFVFCFLEVTPKSSFSQHIQLNNPPPFLSMRITSLTLKTVFFLHKNHILVRGPNEYRLIGETIDDSMGMNPLHCSWIGECFDKIARLLAGIDKSQIPFYNPHQEYNYQPITFDQIGIGFDSISFILESLSSSSSSVPVNGSFIEQWASEFDRIRSSLCSCLEYIHKHLHYTPQTYSAPSFKIPMRQRKDLNFSFCGLKTAVTRYIMKYSPLDDIHRNHIAFEFQKVACQHIVDRIQLLYQQYPTIHHLVWLLLLYPFLDAWRRSLLQSLSSSRSLAVLSTAQYRDSYSFLLVCSFLSS